MAKDSAWNQFFFEDSENERLLWNLERLVRELIVRLWHQPITRRTLRFVDKTAILVSRVASNLCKRLPPDSAQPTHLHNGRAIDFRDLQ